MVLFGRRLQGLLLTNALPRCAVVVRSLFDGYRCKVPVLLVQWACAAHALSLLSVDSANRCPLLIQSATLLGLPANLGSSCDDGPDCSDQYS